MKNKRILILCIVFVSMLALACTTIQAQDLGYEPSAEMTEQSKDIEKPLAQNEVTPTATQALPNYQYNNPVLDNSAPLEKYGFVGTIVTICLGLVVFMVKQDRKTMSEQNDSQKDLVTAIAANTSATKELTISIQAEIRQIGTNLNLRFDSLEKSMERNGNT